jgi:hypothetical protein
VPDPDAEGLLCSHLAIKGKPESSLAALGLEMGILGERPQFLKAERIETNAASSSRR